MLDEKLSKQINEAVNQSGIYQFIGKNDEILYIGKAKNLRKRLISYTKPDKLSNRIRRMTFLAQKIETTQTNSDLEAILLEHNLIKKHKPKFNILLKDDKRFAEIAIDKKHHFGAIFKTRSLNKKDIYSFGPFASGFDVNRVIDVLRKNFKLRNCSDSEFSRRKKPCMEFQIKKCSAPCVGEISLQDYQKSIHEAIDFLSGKSSQIQVEMARQMRIFSEEQQYEKAAEIRDKIKSLSSIQATQNINSSEVFDADMFVFVKKNGLGCFYVTFFRGGNCFGSKPYFFEEKELSENDFFEDFLGQFYQNEVPPKEIFLNHEISEIKLMEDFLSEIGNLNGNCKKIHIKIPKQGEKLRLLSDQEKIAHRVLEEKIAKNLSDKKLLVELKETFNLEKIPERIEIYDNSHISGENAVGAFVVAGLEGFERSQYRKFNIRFEEKNRDDTAMMKEVLKRRFKKTNEGKNQLPDLVIIDGGLPQLSAVREVFSELEIKIPLICMAKGENRNAGEETYFNFDKSITQIQKGSALAFFLQRLRDEAHRFAISTHRSRRGKEITKSKLDEIKGVGSKRKKLLLNHFGSIEKVKQASIEDLMRVDGISRKVAQGILEAIT
jgi:excinuclease ABC subunit C